MTDELSIGIKQPFTNTRSTLLIPEKIFSKYVNQYRKIQNLPVSIYLKKILRDEQLVKKISDLTQDRIWKKKYQNPDQNLIRFNFYPDERDWAKLSFISRVSGYSRCFIFIYLLLLDMESNRRNGGTPPNKSFVSFKKSIRVYENLVFERRILKKRMEMYG